MMLYLIMKFGLTALTVVIISEVARKSSFFGAFIASLPIISILSFIWIYIDTKDINKISELSKSILVLVLPSLVFFIAMPMCINKGYQFNTSMLVSILATSITYLVLIYILKLFQVSL